MNKKIIIWIFISLFLISNFVFSIDWSLNKIEYTNNSFNFSAQSINAYDIKIYNNGTKLYVIDRSSLQRINEYNLITPYDISTASFITTVNVYNSYTNDIRGIYINNNGTRLYIFSKQNRVIRSYTMSPWNISTAIYDNKQGSAYNEDTNPTSFNFNNNGTKVYMAGRTTDKIHQYSLSTAWDISTMTYDSIYLDISSYDTSIYSIQFNEIGDKLMMVGVDNDKIYLLNLLTPYDLSTAINNSDYSLSTQISSPYGFSIPKNGENVYVQDGLTHIIYQYILGKSNFTVTANNNITSLNLIDFNITLDGINYDDNSTSSVITELLPNSTTLHNITINKYGYYSQTFTNYNVSENLEVSLYPDHTELTVTATNYLSNSINNFTAYAESFNSSNTSFKLTTSGTAVLWLKWNETYNISVDSDNHAEYLNFATITMDNFTKSLSIDDLYITNTINFTFKDEVTNTFVTGVSVYLISDIYANNYSSGSYSNLTVDMIEPSNYEVLYTASSYADRSFSFLLSDRSYNNFTLYMANYSNTANITAYVYDETGSKLANALIEVLKYDYLTNSYKLVEQKATNFNGLAVINLEKNNVYYKFRVKYDDVIRLTTEPTFIYQDTISFSISTQEDAAKDFFNKGSISYNLVFNKDTNNFRFEYSDGSNSLVTKACVYVTSEFNGVSTSTYNSSCVSASSGVLLVGVNEINKTKYVANAYVTIDGEAVFMSSDSIYFGVDANTGLLGLLLVTLLMITFALLFSWNLIAAIVMFPVPLWLGPLIGLITIDISVGLFMQVFSIIIAVVISRSS